MSFKNVTSGTNLPTDINVIIEIPANAPPVKYEVDKDQDALVVDRFLASPMFYPLNYGYINNTLSDDGDPVDVLVLTPHAIQAGAVIRARPVAILHMEDESGIDAKILALPHKKLTNIYEDISDLDDIPKHLLDQVMHFFEYYKKLEPKKWVKVTGWGNKNAAQKEILAGHENYINKK